uniref:uncharacterized protein si:ch211-67e16.4 isoform X1 n=1 Tax=Gasterosteus aculeatus aculeatus TaxID=481459 RepID=UPI001A99C235|nr:uncharacterized protein si:ch211-67e16.4 isoform X1 [Gasterosteus aculeatus aculeatus]XP_040056798.1 uncharacterized protein si:ch211-67e16.4 isoform X1 [Gasterosteus aculeatus aculeatus]
MDVSIAVTLIRGQMGAVVERAVNGAVETVLAEMLKVVGVKFEELKCQVALMKRDVATLQREKVLKEKENDNIRAKLRYTELKLKYYRQGVEEELQQRASGALQAHRDAEGVSSTEASQSCFTQTRTSSGHALFCPAERDTAQSNEQKGDSKWSFHLPPHAEGSDAAATPPVRPVSLDPGQHSANGSPSHDGSAQADSSTLPSSAPQVKQEAPELQPEEEEVICIKEEPKEDQEVTASLLLDCHVQQGPFPVSEAQRSATECLGPPVSQRSDTAAFGSSGPNPHLMPQPVASLLQPMVALPCGVLPRQAPRPWPKDLSLYEEYKLRRNELRRRSINRRRELEKTLPQPLLADLVRERREKTRLRVARWRAKRKLQDCIKQDHSLGGAAGLSPAGFALSSQHQQPRGTCASGSQQRLSSAPPPSDGFLSDPLPFIPTSSSSSSFLYLGGHNMAPHQHTVTSSACCSRSPR